MKFCKQYKLILQKMIVNCSGPFTWLHKLYPVLRVICSDG